MLWGTTRLTLLEGQRFPVESSQAAGRVVASREDGAEATA
jgi:hypothetical protein